jgi:hypothetical protein
MLKATLLKIIHEKGNFGGKGTLIVTEKPSKGINRVWFLGGNVIGLIN